MIRDTKTVLFIFYDALRSENKRNQQLEGKVFSFYSVEENQISLCVLMNCVSNYYKLVYLDFSIFVKTYAHASALKRVRENAYLRKTLKVCMTSKDVFYKYTCIIITFIIIN